MSGEETVSILMPFLPEENRGDGPEGLMVNGRQSGLADAVSKYAWSGKNFAENKAELDQFAADLRSAIQQRFQ